MRLSEKSHIMTLKAVYMGQSKQLERRIVGKFVQGEQENRIGQAEKEQRCFREPDVGKKKNSSRMLVLNSCEWSTIDGK